MGMPSLTKNKVFSANLMLKGKFFQKSCPGLCPGQTISDDELADIQCDMYEDILPAILIEPTINDAVFVDQRHVEL